MSKIQFIYNAEDGFFSKITDFAHKIIKPETYECSLCAITHGNIGMKKEWKSFIENLEYEVSFHYRNNLDQVKCNVSGFPSIVLEQKGRSEVLISPNELNEIGDINSLKKLLLDRLGISISENLPNHKSDNN